MTNLFSIFDPSSNLSMSLNWVSLLTGLILIPPAFWVSSNQSRKLLKKLLGYIYTEFSPTLGTNTPPGSLALLMALFVGISIVNALGLLPYIFTPTSHLSISISLALPLWLGHMSMAWIKNTSSCLAHLVPLGTPALLMPFMVVIELISSLIRPLTLSVRLAANMVAGHLLLALLSGAGHISQAAELMLILACLIPLILLESAVALVQAYVFSLLSTLYLAEVAHPKLG